jgi:hypothetical protein
MPALGVIAVMLGHSTIEMTMRYAHLSPTVHLDAVARLDAAPPDLGHHLGTKVQANSQLRVIA